MYLSTILFIQLLICTVSINAQVIEVYQNNNGIDKSSCDSIYKSGDMLPIYKNGPLDILYFMSNNIVPLISNFNTEKSALISSLKIELAIDKSGKVIEVKFLNQINEELGQKLANAFYMMSDWNPGKIDRQNVCMKIILPINCIKWE